MELKTVQHVIPWEQKEQESKQNSCHTSTARNSRLGTNQGGESVTVFGYTKGINAIWKQSGVF